LYPACEIKWRQIPSNLNTISINIKRKIELALPLDATDIMNDRILSRVWDVRDL
jgi:hypothetical protein